MAPATIATPAAVLWPQSPICSGSTSGRARRQVYLSVVGAFGIICWLGTIRAVKAGKRWARGAATAMLALGTGIAVIDLLVRDTSGDTGLPPLLGWAGMLPSLAGLLAVTLLWRRS